MCIYRFFASDNFLLAIAGIFLAAFLFYGMPALNQIQQKQVRMHAIVSDNVYSFNDTVAMVRYTNGWLGLGAITSTIVTVQNGVDVPTRVYTNDTLMNWPSLFYNTKPYSSFIENQTIRQFVFDGYLIITVGQRCIISYELVIHVDNETNLTLLSITQTS